MNFIKTFIGKNRPEDIKYDDILNFKKRNVEEHLHLEYKPRGILLDSNDNVKKPNNKFEIIGYRALAKSVASFANSAGGLLILGIKEKTKKINGKILKIEPGAINPLPATIERESIELNIQSHIQKRIENITIVPIRKSKRTMNSIYLIDIPQSMNAPHRVDELFYYQRINFSTIEMQHYQIEDLFGKRRKPLLSLSYEIKFRNAGNHNGKPWYQLLLEILIINKGSAIAKYPFIDLNVEKPYCIEYMSVRNNYGLDLRKIGSNIECEHYFYSGGPDTVVFPDTSLHVSTITGSFHEKPTVFPDIRLYYRILSEETNKIENEIIIKHDEIIAKYPIDS